jgi:hypothetical protein
MTNGFWFGSLGGFIVGMLLAVLLTAKKFNNATAMYQDASKMFNEAVADSERAKFFWTLLKRN